MKASSDINIIIYVGIIVISIISSIVKSLSKKKEIVAQPAQQVPQKSLEDIFRELVDIPQEPRQKPAAAVQPVINQPVWSPKPKIVTPVKNDRLALEKHCYNQIENVQSPVYQTDVQLNSAQEWQKAFIYSEIFNRKY